MRNGFTLLEVVIAIGVFALGAVAAIGLFVPVAKSAADNADAEAAARAAEAVALYLKSQTIPDVATRLKNSEAGGHQLLREDREPGGHSSRADAQILFANRDGSKVGGYDDAIWRESASGVPSDREKFFEIALIRNEALSPIGSESDLASPYLGYSARVRWPAFVADRGAGAIEIGENASADVRHDHSQQRVFYFSGVIRR